MHDFNNEKLSYFIDREYKTNKDFAKTLNGNGLKKSEDAIKKWRQGNSTPKTTELLLIANLLNITILDLFDNTELQVKKILKAELKNPSQETQTLLERYCTQKNFNNSGVIGSGSVVSNSHNTTEQTPQLTNHRALTLLEFFNEKDEQEQREILKTVMGF